ncbi:MAG: hypothetical protein EXS24_04055 [Pedosphaera sp.]|nr:hypothetical protein [Pedosphaera sp.]
MAAKLGIKSGADIHLAGAPTGYLQLLAPLPDGVKVAARLSKSTDFVQIFASRKAALAAALKTYRAKLKPTTTVWISWPKKSAMMPDTIVWLRRSVRRHCACGGGKMRIPTMPVACVEIGKGYVSFHLMGVYGCPKLLDGHSKELLARMQGKSCFNFKTVNEPLFAELARLTSASLNGMRKAGFISK